MAKERIRVGLVVGAAALVASACGVAVVGDFDRDGRTDRWYWKVVGPAPDDVAWFQHGDPVNPVASLVGIPVEGDFDGDGSVEPSSVAGDTWITGGTRGSFTFTAPPYTPFGGPPSVGGTEAHVFPVPLRWNGPTTKAAWYRDSDATWWIEGEPAPIPFGVGDDGVAPHSQSFPIPGDFDGDGDDELAVYHPLTRSFEIQGQPGQVQVGAAIGFPAAADFDGDGTDDFAVLMGNVWAIEGQPDSTTFGHPGSLASFPVLGDFDEGPGTEAAIFAYPNVLQYESATGTTVTIDYEPGSGNAQRIPSTTQMNAVFFGVRMTTLVQHCASSPDC